MSDQPSSGAKLEIAHVLLIDIVGYSKLLIDDQQAAVRELNAVVRTNSQFRAADADGKVVRLPTGDGVALVFFTTPEAPVRCAVEMTRVLRAHDPSLPVRMGVHSGPVTSVKDDQGTNVAGAGINLAQRVMDCGDAGHILLSQRVAEDIGEFRELQPHLHDIGQCAVKHEVRVHLFNLRGADFGNPALPLRVAQVRLTASKLRRSRFSWRAAATLLMVIALLLLGWFWHSRRTSQPNIVSDKSIAVLPFENFSDDKANAFFADGIQDDILTSLAKIRDLRVISRTSVESYRAGKDSRNLSEIAKTLGVANVLEGSVRREGNRVIVNVQLIDAVQDRHLWANRYELTLQDSLGIDGQVARAIADALRARLTPEEAARVQSKPTQNTQAYDLYLQAKEYEFKPDTFLQDYRTAEQLYVQAITLDPNFALAHALLAATCARIYHFYEPTDTWKKRARAEAEIALQLQPNLGEAHHALGLCYYWFNRDYENALREFGIAKTLLPNDSTVSWDIAAIKRRQGHWQETVADYRQILRLDPQNANVIRDLLYVYCAMRDWPNAEATAQRLIALTPNSLNAKAQIGYVDFWAKGSTARLRSEMATVQAGKDPDGAVTAFRIDASMIDRDPAVAERALLASPLDTFSYFNGVDTPRSFFAGEIALLRGDHATARAELERARDIFAAYAKEAPDVAERHAFLGLVCAMLGEKQRAISEGTRAVELRPESQDALDGTVFNAVLALIYARVGDNDHALVLLQHLLAVPGAVDSASYSITLNDLKFRWEWDPLRNDPRFQKLIAREHQ
jgi:TolB-like protein/class 3 adenylate cyclase/Flp pilus assembly protein TadD